MRMRQLVSRGFTPRRVNELEGRILDLTRQYLDPALAAGEFDWIGEFAGKLPMDVISELMGVPEADRVELRRLADLVVHREEGVLDVPHAGDGGVALPRHLLRRHAGRAPQEADRGPHVCPARSGDRRRPADRRRDHRVHVPDGGGGQRDHHQTARQRTVLGFSLSGRGQARVRGCEPGAGVGRGDPAVRHVQSDRRANRRPTTWTTTTGRFPPATRC